MYRFKTFKYLAASRLLEKIKQLPSAGQGLYAEAKVFDEMKWNAESEWSSQHHLTLFRLEESFLKVLTCSAAKNERTAWGDTPLHIACSEANKECVEGILLLNPKINIQNQMGYTPLHEFLNSPSEDEGTLQKLLDAGANPDIPDADGYSPLHTLALQLETEKTAIFVRLLVEHKANVDSQNKFQETPLHIATDEGKEHLVKILLESGASIDKPDVSGRSPMDIALSKRSQYPRILELLSEQLIILYWCRCSVNLEHLEEVSKNETSRIFNKRCEKEIEQLRSTYVGDSTATYYKILVSSTHTVARFLFNTNILVSLLEFDKEQSIFGPRVMKKFEAALKRYHAIKLGIVSAKNIFPSLPDVFVYELIKYLDINDCVDLDKVCPIKFKYLNNVFADDVK